MVIEKKTVIEALKKEPLRSGRFFASRKIKSCNVCAVGAVIRRSLDRRLKNFSINDVEYYCTEVTDYEYAYGNVKVLLIEKNYLGALSNYFEGLQDFFTKTSKENRELLIKFVKKNFPTRFTVPDIKK